MAAQGIKIPVDEEAVRPTRWTALSRGFRGRCPNCGVGRLFRAYLKLVDNCSNCHEKLGDIRADDIPAWATILVVGHVVVPFFIVAVRYDWPTWVAMGVLLPATLGLTFILLPRMKGMIAALLWSLGMSDGTPGPGPS